MAKDDLLEIDMNIKSTLSDFTRLVEKEKKEEKNFMMFITDIFLVIKLPKIKSNIFKKVIKHLLKLEEEFLVMYFLVILFMIQVYNILFH